MGIYSSGNQAIRLQEMVLSWCLKGEKNFHRQKTENMAAQEKAQANAHSLKNEYIDELTN